MLCLSFEVCKENQFRSSNEINFVSDVIFLCSLSNHFATLQGWRRGNDPSVNSCIGRGLIMHCNHNLPLALFSNEKTGKSWMLTYVVVLFNYGLNQFSVLGVWVTVMFGNQGMFTLVCPIAFAPAPEPHRIGLLFTHNNSDFVTIFVTKRSCAAPISKSGASHIGQVLYHTILQCEQLFRP